MAILNNEMAMNIGDKVQIIGGNYDFGCPSMVGRIGVIKSFGTKYTVNGRQTKEVYVEFFIGREWHVFNDYHCKLLTDEEGGEK